MSTIRKKTNKAAKNKKRITENVKDAVEQKDSREVCVIESMTLLTRFYRCDDVCCCLI